MLTISVFVVAALEAVFIAAMFDRRDHLRELLKANARIAELESLQPLPPPDGEP